MAPSRRRPAGEPARGHAQHWRYPARVVILKISRFEAAEAGGLREALKEADVRYSDLIWISESSPITMFREGDYPPLRGTMIGLEREALLFTRGGVPLYRTYPGLRSPRPIVLRPYRMDTPMGDVAKASAAARGCLRVAPAPVSAL